MKTISVRSKAGTDGVLHLEIPVEAANVDYEVVVVLQPARAVASGWPPGFIEQTAGSIPDETFVRHDQGQYEERTRLE